MSVEVLKVVAAAIRDIDGEVFSVPAPGRHCDVIRLMAEKGRKCPPLDCQGFLLSDGRFCRRKPAKFIAERAGQLLERASKLAELFSEDVW
jgi:hypothetical protein